MSKPSFKKKKSVLDDIPPSMKKDVLLAEYERRFKMRSQLEQELFPLQLNFLNDPAKHKAIFCPRRSGKSTAIGIYLIQQALLYPDRKMIYLSLNQSSAENIIWQHIIQATLDKYKIPYHYNLSRKTVTFQNKSSIKLGGIEASPSEMKKVLGGKYHLVVIDECQDITQDLKMIVEDCVAPAVADYVKKDGGIIVLAGTPGSHMGEHYWFQVTKTDANGMPSPDRMKGWSVHEWQVVDNPHMVDEFGQVCEELMKVRGPAFQEDPSFRTQWLGQWVIEQSKLVYKYDYQRNALFDPPNSFTISELIKKLQARHHDFTYVMGVDLGWEDATAIVIGAYSKNDPKFYIVESQKFNHTNFGAVASTLLGYQKKYNIQRIVVDTGGGGKFTAESFKEVYGLPIYPAEKGSAKEVAVARMNSDFICSLIKVIADSNKELIKEWQELLIDAKKLAEGVWKEAEKYHNHLADAALYAFNDAKHFWGKEPGPPRPRDFADELLARRRQLRPIRFKDDYDAMDRFEEEREAQEIVERFRLNDKKW